MPTQTIPPEPVCQQEQRGDRSSSLAAELERLSSEVLALGQIIEEALVESAALLQQRAPMTVEPLITLDHRISKKRFAIEMDGLALIVAQQPFDGDLRRIASALEIVTELEHIGGYIMDIARIHLIVVQVEEPLKPVVDDIREMAGTTRDMVSQALKAYARQDPGLARTVHAADERVDRHYRQVFHKVLAFMSGKPRATIKQARYLAQIARNLERAADRVTNICEWVVFAVTGEMREIAIGPDDNVLKGEN